VEERYYQTEAAAAFFDFYSVERPLDAEGNPIKKNPLIAMPTGTGKSVVIGKIIKTCFELNPYTRFFMSTHVKTLIQQNANKLKEIWPEAPLGIYSAGLNSRDMAHPIIFGGVQSCVKKTDLEGRTLFGKRDFLFIDEAHLLNDEGNYIRFINELQAVNPFLKVCGFTATPYRLRLGAMTNGSIFTDVIYDITTLEAFNRLVAEGYLCQLIPKPTKTKLDISSVNISNTGEFVAGQLQAAVDKNDTNYSALCEIVEHGHDRRSWLIFASGVEHAEHLTETLNSVFGISAVAIHSKKSEAENDRALAAWKNGEIRCAVNMNQLTTGVDHPACDLIGMLRPTMSTGLWVQMLGRGTRPCDGKNNCLVLDFAGNITRLGPINDPLIPRLKGKGPPGDAPVKICSVCGVYNHISSVSCIACGANFVFEDKLNKHASTTEIMRSDVAQIEAFNVDRVIITRHVSRATKIANPHVPEMALPFGIQVAYYCGFRVFYEHLNFEAVAPLVRHKAREWFRQRFPYNQYPQVVDGQAPERNADVLNLISFLRNPTKINVWVNLKYPRVQSYEF
jgi:DNA repair protein RadD